MGVSYSIIIGTVVMLVMALFMILFVVYYQRKQMAHQIRAKEMEMEFQRKLLEVAMASAESERRRIAQDLHDDVGALLSVTKLTFNALYHKLGSRVEAERLAGQVREALDETISHVRRISRELVPTTLERFGLSAALQEFTAKSNVSNAVRLTYSFEGDEARRFDAQTELMLYRVAQELINNALKHSQANHIHVHLWQDPYPFKLMIKDNGNGFDVDAVRKLPSSGLGLQSIEGRLNIIGGTLLYDSRHKQGCQAIVELKKAPTLDKTRTLEIARQ